ncbi:SitA6 family polymorphic toxin lipoprotein [Pyxidicoccus xibeiensis]|uniref:SitA6 family polymorphic toxin lipoprotein n=1 Tax=Pyxidicoccus xibeiensis TaxID=2906759 RepID=UPI0020A73467|nr:TIGR02269 family lipoprotein [Pyxidicoccus xibeiensis]MCP3142747.1 TIGR02269 family lipoprotein [Pyxidicoccus xibeiensis]
MGLSPLVRLLPLVALVLSGCAASAPSLSCEREGQHSCVVLACEEEDCGLFSCEDLDPDAAAPKVERAQGAYRPPHRPPAFRNWRNSGIRSGARPRMTFHFRYRQGFLPALPREPGKLVHHHLFPQEPGLARWFKRNGVDIHKFTILIPEHIHRELHSGTGRGGMWNQAWRDFRDSMQGGSVTPEVLHRKAVELIFRFQLTGPVVPYNAPLAPYQQLGPQLRTP